MRLPVALTVQEIRHSEVFPADPCRLWTGRRSRDGYALLGNGEGAYRAAFVEAGGSIPDGYTIDHLCHDPESCEGGPGCIHRRCVNPRHLTATARGENARRAVSANARKTHCPKGHPYSPDNTFHRSGKPGRECRACRREDSRARRRAMGIPVRGTRVQASVHVRRDEGLRALAGGKQ